jgi:hypothetical protein
LDQMYFFVFNFFRDAILISYTAGFHEGRLFSYLQVYKNEEKTQTNLKRNFVYLSVTMKLQINKCLIIKKLFNIFVRIYYWHRVLAPNSVSILWERIFIGGAIRSLTLPNASGFLQAGA